MRTADVIKRRDRAVAAVHDIFTTAIEFGTSHEEMLKMREEHVYSHLRKGQGSRPCPQWAWSYVSAVWDTLQAQAYHEHLIFGGYVNGTFCSTHSNRLDYYEKQGVEPCQWSELAGDTKAHYWAKSLKRFG